MSILATQNINNLEDDFGRAQNNPFPTQQREEAQVGWAGYAYGAPDLDNAMNPTPLDERLTPTGEALFNNESGNAYGPVSQRMSDSQSTILGSIQAMLADPAVEGSTNMWAKMKYTFSNSIAVRSLNINGVDAGGNALSSGEAVPSNNPNNEYRLMHGLETNMQTLPDGTTRTTINGTDIAQGFGAEAGSEAYNTAAISDYDKSGKIDFNDFFMMADAIAAEGLDFDTKVVDAKSPDSILGLNALGLRNPAITENNRANADAAVENWEESQDRG